MPRLIPRLLRNLEYARSLSPRPSRKSRRPPNAIPPAKRIVPRPEEVDISPTGRSKSILLDSTALRSIYQHSRYERVKEPTPELRFSRAKWEAKRRRGLIPEGAVPRVMSQEEKRFWANPYLRMLGSPLRQCYQTGWMLPRDLLIGMTSMLIPGEPHKAAFLPTGLEHPSFRPSRGGKVHYALCRKPLFQEIQKTGAYKRWRPDSKDLVMHSLVVQQIGHALRVRVIQELQVLAKDLRRRQQPTSPPLLRRLTRAELNSIKSSGVVPYENAVAILVVPPVNNKPGTKERPQPNFTSIPQLEDMEAQQHSSQHPLSVLYTVTKGVQELPVDDPLLPPARVPLYNGVPLFPSRTQRAALYSALNEVLRAEKVSRLSIAKTADTGPLDFAPVKGDRKASHAVLVCSDEHTLLRGDTTRLAIALWRLRMWEASEVEEGLIDWTVVPVRET